MMPDEFREKTHDEYEALALKEGDELYTEVYASSLNYIGGGASGQAYRYGHGTHVSYIPNIKSSNCSLYSSSLPHCCGFKLKTGQHRFDLAYSTIQYKNGCEQPVGLAAISVSPDPSNNGTNTRVWQLTVVHNSATQYSILR